MHIQNILHYFFILKGVIVNMTEPEGRFHATSPSSGYFFSFLVVVVVHPAEPFFVTCLFLQTLILSRSLSLRNLSPHSKAAA